MKDQVRQELIERYEKTGKLGFTKPNSKEEAYALIDLIANYEEPEEKVILNITDLTNKMKCFFDKF